MADTYSHLATFHRIFDSVADQVAEDAGQSFGGGADGTSVTQADQAETVLHDSPDDSTERKGESKPESTGEPTGFLEGFFSRDSTATGSEVTSSGTPTVDPLSEFFS